MFLVTGGSGFCGFEIVKFLCAKGCAVRVLDIEPLPQAIPSVEYFKADIRDAEAVTKACSGIERIIHTVAKVPISKAGREFWSVNVEGTRNLLEAAVQNKVKKIVHISSSAVQLSGVNPVDEYADYHPIGLYARSKMEGEKVCLGYVKKGLSIDIIRPRTVVGRGRLGIFDILFDWISGGRKIYIIGRGQNKIQFLHSEDLASCCYLSSLIEGSHIFNVGSSGFRSLREDLGAVIDHAKTGSKIISLPALPSIAALMLLDALRLSPLASWHYLTYHKDFYFNNQRAKDILGWSPHYGNRSLLIEAYEDYKNHEAGRSSTYGTSHRKALRQGILKLVKLFS